MPRRETLATRMMNEPVLYGGMVVPRHLAMRHLDVTFRHRSPEDRERAKGYFLLNNGPERVEAYRKEHYPVEGPQAEAMLRKEIDEMLASDESDLRRE